MDPDLGSVAPDAGLLHGDLLGTSPGQVEPATGAWLIVAGGPDAGGYARLNPGQGLTVGRGHGSDLVVHDRSLSRRHLRIRQSRRAIEVADLDSTNGLEWVPGEVSGPGDDGDAVVWTPGSRLLIGQTELMLHTRHAPPLATTPTAGRLLVRPWPRTAQPVEKVELTRPAAPEPRSVRPPSAWAWLLPLVAAVLVAAVLRMPLFLIFGLLGPAMVLGHYLGERRSVRREHAEARATWELECRKVGDCAEVQLRAEQRVRAAQHPGLVGPVTALVPAPSTHLWARAAEAPEVVVGHGPVISCISLDGMPLRHDWAPVTVRLDKPLVIVGPGRDRDALVRSLLLQLATSHPPEALLLVLPDTTRLARQWDFLAWLPHVISGGTGDAPAGSAEPVPTTICWGTDLVQVDDVAQAPPGMPRLVLDPRGRLVVQRPGEPEAECSPTMLSLARARDLARRLAPLAVAAPGGTTGPGPAMTGCTLGDLVSWPQDVAATRQGWEAVPCGSTRVVLGTGPDGESVAVDLARDGPHALLAGTTGSGKSEALRTLVTSLALTNRPSELSFLLIDYKGGSSLGDCASLPHTTGLVTDLDPQLAGRVLTSLQAELKRREEELARSGARDLASYRGNQIPRLVVVIDEFRVLAEEVPDVLDGLVRVAAVGRSLGVHLVLATQRPAGVVSADLRANVNLRIALRVRDPADSYDVLDRPDAAHLPEGCPGRGLIGTGSGQPRPVQVAPALGPSRSELRWQVTEVADLWAGRALLEDPGATGVGAGLEDLVPLMVEAADQLDDRARRVWLPPLPDTILPDAVHAPGPDGGHPQDGDAVERQQVWAVADRPEEQRREPLGWDASEHVGVVGSARSGRSTALTSLALAGPPAWLYVFDLGHGLAGSRLRDHPGLRAWVAPDEAAHGARVLEVLLATIRQRLGTRQGDHAPVVVVIDGWDRFVDGYGELDRGQVVETAIQVLREGPAAGVICLVSGDRGLLSGRVASLLPVTWALRLNDPNDLLMTGLRPQQVPRHQPPGRVVRTKDGLVAQVVLADPSRASGSSGSNDDPPTDAPAQERSAPGGTAPPRITALPMMVTHSHGVWALGGDEAEPVGPLVGSVLVLGPAGSGVSSTLSLLAASRDTCLVVAGPGSWTDDDLSRALHDHRGTVAVDDTHLLTGTPTEDLLLHWAQSTGGDLLVAGELEACSGAFRGIVPLAARSRQGIVLQPTSPGHGAALGVQLPGGDLRIPGRGVLVRSGRCQRIQVAHQGG